MFANGIRSELRLIAAGALAATVIVVGATAGTTSADTVDGYATAWMSITDNANADYIPPSGGTPPSNPLGPSDSLCLDSSFASNVFELTFGSFVIPAGATIDGIEVTLDAGKSSGDSPDITLTDGSNVAESNTKPFNPPSATSCNATTETTLGSPTDDWSTTLTAADFAAGNFGVRIAGAIFMDSIEFTVHFSGGGSNTAPVADAGGPYTVDEGGTVALSGAASSDADGDTLTYAWDLDNDGTFGDATGVAPTFTAVGRDGADTQTIALVVNDGTADSAPVTATVNIVNVAPTINSITTSASSIDEGDSVTVSGSFSDPALGVGTETFSGSALWSDDTITPLTLGAGTFSTSRSFSDDDPTATPADTFTVDVTISDDDFGSDTATSPVLTVNNVDPVITSSTITPVIDENGNVSLTGDFTDIGVDDTHTVSVDWGDGSTGNATVTQGAGSGSFSASHQYLDDDPTITPSDSYTVLITVTDDDTGTDDDSTATLVENVAPVISEIASDATFDDKAGEGELVTITGAFTDIGTLDTHSATIDWGDGNVTSASVSQVAGGGTLTGDHTYAAGGVYTVTVTVTDDDSGVASDTTLAVVTGVGINAGVLQIVGTDDDDHVHVKTIQDEIDVSASFVDPKHRRYDLADVSSIEIWLCDGDDHGNVHQSIDLPATIHGGEGDDMLWGGSADDVINGGAGDDKIWGRGGSDVLDGGSGKNKIKQ